MPDFKQLHDAILNGDAKSARTITEQALAAGVAPLKLVQEFMMPAMDEVGRRFECNEYFVPELLLAARAMKSALELLRPLLIASGTQPVGRVALGTVKGDLHDIGKNLVCMMAEGAGFEVYDIGVDQSVDKFMAAAAKCSPDIIGMSALLTTTMTYMKTVIDGFEAAGLGNIKMAVGGAPISQMFADEIGADGYGANASAAVDLFLRLAASRKQDGDLQNSVLAGNTGTNQG